MDTWIYWLKVHSLLLVKGSRGMSLERTLEIL